MLRCLDRQDSSGIRFYIGKERRQYEIGYLTLGTVTDFLGIAIPPRAERFNVDSYCPANSTMVSVTDDSASLDRCPFLV